MKAVNNAEHMELLLRRTALPETAYSADRQHFEQSRALLSNLSGFHWQALL